MIDFLVVALLQAVAGDPEPPAATPEPAATETVQTEAPAEEAQPSILQQRRCSSPSQDSGSRLRRRPCTSSSGDLTRRTNSDVEAAQAAATQMRAPPSTPR